LAGFELRSGRKADIRPSSVSAFSVRFQLNFSSAASQPKALLHMKTFRFWMKYHNTSTNGAPITLSVLQGDIPSTGMSFVVQVVPNSTQLQLSRKRMQVDH
jgi:hypothetical protein